MDKTIPGSAGFLLNFISVPESNGDYDVYNSFKQGKLPKKLTKMTINEVLAINYKAIGAASSAAGRYQIIRATLKGLVTEIGLTGREKFDANMQDRLAYHLLRRRGYDAWAHGRIDHIEFGKRLAQEWASLPVLAGTKGSKGSNIKRGSSYYAGDGLNSHGVTADAFENALEDAFTKHERFFYEGKPAKVDKGLIATGVAVGTGAGAVVVENQNSLPDLDTAIKVGNYVQSALTSGSVVFAGIVLAAVAVGGYVWWKNKRG